MSNARFRRSTRSNNFSFVIVPKNILSKGRRDIIGVHVFTMSPGHCFIKLVIINKMLKCYDKLALSQSDASISVAKTDINDKFYETGA